MNITKLFEMQRVLDPHIEEEHPRQPGEDRLAKKILALQVELGELANEQRSWKFWSHDQKPRIKKICSYCNGRGFHDFFEPFGEGHNTCECGDCEGTGFIKDRNPLLEEYVDCLHFVLSIGLELEININLVYSPEAYIFGDDITKTLTHLIGDAAMLNSGFEEIEEQEYTIYVNHFMYLGKLLGFTWEQVFEAYMSKNKVNHERQLNGY